MNPRIAAPSIALTLAVPGLALAGADPAPLVAGVSRIVSGGASGPVHPLSGAWSAIAAGDEDASFPSLFVAARDYGAGRVVIVGHDGFLVNTGELDNGRFLLNTLRWLDVAATGRVGYTTGHREWLGAGNLGGLEAIATSNAMHMSGIPAPLSAASLRSVSVLIVGNAWGSMSAAEIEAVRAWVESGGGLLMAGLGWSWPGGLEDWPMMWLAEPYEVRWLRGVINDPTNHVGGSAIFHRFYPDVTTWTVDGAIEVITAAHLTHGANLPAAIEADGSLRRDFVRAHEMLGVPAGQFPAGDPQRQVVFDAYTRLLQDFPAYYARGFSFDESAHPTSAHLRERAWRSWRDALELTRARKAMMARIGRLVGRRLDIFHDFDLVLQDNDRLEFPEMDLVHRMLSATPGSLYDLWGISVRDYLGTAPTEVSLGGIPYGVNIFGVEIGQQQENPFPPDVPAFTADIFYSVLAHELNHAVDATTIGRSPALSARRNQLIADAGHEPLNYLRTARPGFFVEAPQEFFASISNQWYNHSVRTIELGLVRFDAGRPDPINQALFFADVFSRGTASTLFFTADAAGNMTTSPARLVRNTSGWITAMELDTTRYEFDVDGQGRVLSYRRRDPPADTNRPPVATRPLPDRNLLLSDALEIDISQAFVDPDGDALSHAASSSAPGVVTARAAGTVVTLTAVSTGTAAIRVTASDPGGLTATLSFTATVTSSAVFTDDPVVAGVTRVRAVHFTELRARIDGLREAHGLPRFAWSAPIPAPGTAVRLAHLLELREALAAAYAASGRAAPGWTDAAPAAETTPIRAAHLTELRAAVLALE